MKFYQYFSRSPKQTEYARRFCKDVSELHKRKYADLDFFLVTNGASVTRNKGDEAVRKCRETLIDYEKKHGSDPNEDWLKSFSYDPPMSYEKLPQHLKNDPVHKWRAKSGIELIHQEPNYEEFKRICNNWEEMDNSQKKISDKKSKELFGMSNREHMKLLEEYYGRKREKRKARLPQ